MNYLGSEYASTFHASAQDSRYYTGDEDCGYRMARPTYGQLQEFQPETENVTAYLERMDMYLLANQTPEARQVPVFLSSVGGKTFALLRDLLAPSELKSQTLKTLYDTLKAHYEPTPLVIAERF